MSDSSTPPLVSSGRHMRQQQLRSKRYRWIALSCVGLLLLLTGIAGASFMRLRTNVQTDALNLGRYQNEGLADGPLDILVVGSDTRLGANANYGDEADAKSGARADVMMLVQISENRRNVSVLSFPRDLIVDIPACRAQDGTEYPETQDTQINESLSHGGPGCTVATVSSLTGINIDHFMLVDFNAVKSLSNVIGGVDVCVTEEIDDSYSGLKLPAGKSSVEGEQALAFLRSRHGFGDGSDTSRIAAQQSFLASMFRKIQSEGTLTNPSKMMNIAEAITQNVTVDQGLTNPATLVNIGGMVAGIDPGQVVFATVPHEPYAYNDNKLQLADSSAEVFEKLRNDESLRVDTSASANAAASASPSSSISANLSYFAPVLVFNGSGQDKRDQQVASLIEDQKFTNVTSETDLTTYSASAVIYPPEYRSEAEAIAQKLGINQVSASTSYTSITVLVGEDFKDGNQIPQSKTSIAGDAQGQTADEAKCQQSFEY